MGEGLEEEGGFADAGFAAEEDGGAGDDAASEDAVEFGDVGGDAGYFEGGDVGDGGGFTVGDGEVARGWGVVGGRGVGDGGGHGAEAWGGEGFGAVGIFGGFGDFFEGVPSLAVGAFAEPFGVHGAAVAAEEVGFGFGHGTEFYTNGVRWQGKIEMASGGDVRYIAGHESNSFSQRSVPVFLFFARRAAGARSCGLCGWGGEVLD